MNLVYTSAQRQDAAVIYDMCRELVERYEDGTQVNFDKVLPWLEGKTQRNIHQYTRVLLEGKTVAYYCLDTCGERAELDDLYVLPEYRCRGIGTEVLKKCFESTEKPIFLYVFKNNTGAAALYSRMGFTVEREVGATRCIMVRNG